MKRTATAIWSGSLKDGTGRLSTQSGILNDQPYSFKARFEDESGKTGTNPEELLGAAHAASKGYTKDTRRSDGPSHTNQEHVITAEPFHVIPHSEGRD